MANTTLKRSLLVLMALLFGAMLVLVSILPINRIRIGTRAGYNATPQAIAHATELHIGLHILIFGFAAWAAWFVATSIANNSTAKMLALVMTLLLGCTTEYMQHAVYHNPIERWDVVTNLLTIVTVFSLLALIYRNRKPAPPSDSEGIPFILTDLD